MLSDCKGVYLNSKNHFNTLLILSFVLINAQVIDCLFLYCTLLVAGLVGGGTISGNYYRLGTAKHNFSVVAKIGRTTINGRTSFGKL